MNALYLCPKTKQVSCTVLTTVAHASKQRRSMIFAHYDEESENTDENGRESSHLSHVNHCGQLLSIEAAYQGYLMTWRTHIWYQSES